MPNIEVHGLSVSVEAYLENQKIIKAIKEAISGLEFAKDAVVNQVPSTCTDMDGNNQPFIRIYSSNEEHLKPIADLLETIGMDIEIMPPILEFRAKQE